MSAIPHWIPKVMIGLMLAGMTTTLAWQGRTFLQAQKTSGQAAQLPEQDTSQTRSVPDILLGELELFGVRTEASVPEVVEASQLPITNLRLVLRGVAEASQKTPASALIEGPDQETLNYKVGSLLPGNAQLHAVQIASVVLKRGGRLENLRFPEEESLAGMQVDASGTTGSNDDDDVNSYTETTDMPEPDASQNSYDGYAAPAEESEQQYSEPMATADHLNEVQKEEIKARLQELRERLRTGYQ